MGGFLLRRASISMYHETAIISPKAQLGANVSIGPYSVIGAASIGDDSIVHAHAYIGDGVEIGNGVEIFPGAVIGREPKATGAASRSVKFLPFVKIGANCSVGAHAIIYYGVEIGVHSLIGDGASIREQCQIGSYCIISRYVTLNYNVCVGDRVKIMDQTHLTGNMKIENDVFISCLVGTMNDNSIRRGFGDHIVGPTVRRGAVIGGGAILLPAVEVGRDAFVGAGAVVTRDIPANEVWVGNPARLKIQSSGLDE